MENLKMDVEERPFENSLPKWEDPSLLDYNTQTEPSFSEFNGQDRTFPANPALPMYIKTQDWDPRATLNNLSFLEQKIRHLQNLVQLIMERRDQVVGRPNELVVQQQQLITADLTSIIVQLISTAGSLLPSVKHNLASISSPQIEQLGGILCDSLIAPKMGSSGMSQTTGVDHPNVPPDHDLDHDLKDEDDLDEGENLPPGSYEILQLEKEEILAPHTHFCMICGKGFKRDANLRMHMRGHGDEYKTPEALAKPNKGNPESAILKRYSCPFSGCKRNKEHKKFQPLKTILCVKNHYKRTHCDKSYTCCRCNAKKFSVIADLKTHEKHCGKDKWVCSCGTTFSRKDKLFGHIALFQGHTPAIALDESGKGAVKMVAGTTSRNVMDFTFGSGNSCHGTVADEPSSFYFSPVNFESGNFGGFGDLSRGGFEDSESGFSFSLSGSNCGYAQKNGGESSCNNLD